MKIHQPLDLNTFFFTLDKSWYEKNILSKLIISVKPTPSTAIRNKFRNKNIPER